MNYQSYSLGGTPSTARIRRFGGSTSDRWVVGASGYCSPDAEFPGPLKDRVLRRNEPPTGERRFESWDRDWHPVSSGGEDGAVEAALELIDDWYSDIGDRVPWAVAHPTSVGEAERMGILVVGEADGTPPFVLANKVLEIGEFRPCWNRAAGYRYLDESVDVMCARMGVDDLTVAVSPTGSVSAESWLGEVHVRFGDEVRVWPMDWTGLLDAPSRLEAVSVAAEQLRRWVSRWTDANPGAERVPETAGRVWRFDGGQVADDGTADRCSGRTMGTQLEVRPDGGFGYWMKPPFEADSAGTVPVGAYPTI